MASGNPTRVVRIERQLANGRAIDKYVTDADGRKWCFTEKYINAPCRRGIPRLSRVVVDFAGETATVELKYVNVPASTPEGYDAARAMKLIAQLLNDD